MKYQLFDDLLETVDARLRESILQQDLLFPANVAFDQTPSTTNFFQNRLMGQTSFSKLHSSQGTMENSAGPRGRNYTPQPYLDKVRNRKESQYCRIKTLKVDLTDNQFNIANLPYIKYGPEILQDENYQFKIIKDELNILFDKTIEFRTMLTYKYSVNTLCSIMKPLVLIDHHFLDHVSGHLEAIQYPV